MCFSTRKTSSGEARIDPHHRHRVLRPCSFYRPPVLGHALPPGALGLNGHRSLRRNPRGDGEEGHDSLGRLVMSTRERICALEPGRDEIVLTTLRTHEEVRDVEEIGPIDLPKADPRMLDIAEEIIDQQRGDFRSLAVCRPLREGTA